MPSREENQEHRQQIASRIAALPSETITCYTDGSKTDDGTGYGYSITTANNTEIICQSAGKLPDYCSVYQSELIAITTAANKLHDIHSHSIVILTDSLSSLQTLDKPYIKSRTAIECHLALEALALNNSVKLTWVPGHEGHEGNEAADKLAKAGTILMEAEQGYIPRSHIKSSISNMIKIQTQITWNTTTTEHCKQTLGPQESKQHKDFLKELKQLTPSRKKFRIAAQLISGHAALNKHLHKMGLVNSPTCPSCGDQDETVEHLLGHCPAHSQLRITMLNTLYANIGEIFKENSLTTIIKFAQETGRMSSERLSSTSGVT